MLVRTLTDVAGSSKSWDKHLTYAAALLGSISQAGFIVNAEKCKFAQPSVIYQGDVVGSGKHSPYPEKVEAIARELHSVLGL